MKHRAIIPPIVLDPSPDDRVEHPRQVLQALVATQRYPPASHLFTDGFAGSIAHRRQEADEVFAPIVLRPPGTELITEEGKLLVLMCSFSIAILAVDHLGLFRVE